MTTQHLRDAELADATQGHVAPERRQHLTSCGACAAAVAEARATLAIVRDDDVPEPSPLFWSAFAARVSSAIDEAPARVPRARSNLRLALAAAALVLVSVTLVLWQAGNPQGPVMAPHRPPAIAGTAEEALEDDAAWESVGALAADLDYDDAREAGVAPAPGAVDGVAAALSERERAELVRLLEAELKRTGA